VVLGISTTSQQLFYPPLVLYRNPSYCVETNHGEFIMRRVIEFLLLLTMAVLISLASFYSNRNLGVLTNTIKLNVEPRLVFGFAFGLVAAFFLYNLNWKVVMISGILLGVFSAIIFQVQTHLFIPALICGVFIMVFDWVFENLGAKSGYWYSKESAFFVKAVPIEVMISAVSGGFGWILLMPESFDISYTLLVSLIISIGGALGENTLQKAGKMKYGNGWTWLHAFVAYFLVWLFISLVWYFVIKV
jgi:hypothetical protein